MFASRVVIKLLNLSTRVAFGVGRRTEMLADSIRGRRQGAVEDTPLVSAEPPAVHAGNVAYKDIYAGRRGFVIGNGPSLAYQDISVLKGELLFTMNSFDRHPLSRSLSPLHHFLGDPAVNDNSVAMEANLRKIGEAIGDSTVFTVAWPNLMSTTLKGWQAAGRLVTVPNSGVLADQVPDELDMVHGLPAVQSTAQFALMTAVYMGCNPIYLLGLDSDWAASPNLDRHFYAEPTLDESWDRTEYDAYWSYTRILEASLKMFRGYENLREYCREHDVQVFNCTAGGLLDVFPRTRFEDVVGSA